MVKKEVKERIEKLKNLINKARYAYHVLDKPIMSDGALDSLKHNLFELERSFPEFITSDSPTQRIGGKPLDEFRKVHHIIPQWSFNDAFNEEEIRNFDERMKKELEVREVDYTAELKIDGMHIILTYKKGILKTGATRGDGKIGEDVTQNLKTIESIPLRLEKEIDGVFEGEVYMKKSVFENLNEERKKRSEELFANPRNAAAGAIRQLDSKVAAKRHLDCFVYDYSWPEKDIPETQFEELKRIKELGFKVNNNFKFCRNIDEVIHFWKVWEKYRESEDYWIDGIVIKVNRRACQNKLGYTGKAPRWAIAFKWPGEQAATILENVVFQVGRTGKITPVAVLKPVNLKGTVVSRATLHNADELKRLGVKIGDTVIAEKAGDVIPHIVKVLPELRPRNARDIKMPSKCPICFSKVTRPEGEIAHYCSDKSCQARKRERFYYFTSKKAFDIEGLGPKIIDRLMDEGLVFDFSDMFRLKKEDFLPLERFADKSASNLTEAIAKSKEITLGKFLTALGIKYIGEETAELLAENFRDKIGKISDLIRIFQSLSQEEIEKIGGIGPKLGKSIRDWFSEKRSIELLQKLEGVGIKIKSEKPPPLWGEARPASWRGGETKSEKLKGKSFLFTGELESMSREKARDKVKELGGKAGESLSRKTSFLVAGKDPGSKLEKAQRLGVKIIAEKEFLKMIEN